MENHLRILIAQVAQAICEEDCTVTVTKNQDGSFMLQARCESGPGIVTVRKHPNGVWFIKAGLYDWIPFDNVPIISYINGITEEY